MSDPDLINTEAQRIATSFRQMFNSGEVLHDYYVTNKGEGEKPERVYLIEHMPRKDFTDDDIDTVAQKIWAALDGGSCSPEPVSGYYMEQLDAHIPKITRGTPADVVKFFLWMSQEGPDKQGA